MCSKNGTLRIYFTLNRNYSKKVVPKKSKIDNKKKYSHTIQLPATEFPHWMSSLKRIQLDDHILNHCGFEGLYSWQRKNLCGPEFVLHDGPPYANGLPHMGHAINKILKDIINRSKIINGIRVDYQPGWDCHGLPIELKAVKNKFGLDPITIRGIARKYANDAVNDQRKVFQKWGIMADWENGCYYTFDSKYVKNQIKQFYNLYKKKLIYREMKPIYWSPSSRTALAEAELEYKPDHISEAVTVRLKLEDSPFTEFNPLYLLIWTTTPWSLPANEAVAFNPMFDYSIIEMNGEHYIICSKLLEKLCLNLKTSIKEKTTFKGDKLTSCKYKHPLKDCLKPVLPAGYVTDDIGTGLVHTAPSHGPDDYLLALNHRIPIVSFVDDLGNYTIEAGDKLIDMPAMGAGMVEVLKLIDKDIIFREEVKHSYPYDWRTKKPVMIRASKQWFIDTNALKDRAIDALKGVKIIPERNTAGLQAQIESRPFWCISRQRAWGVPIPVLYDQNDNVIISEELIDHYLKLVDEEGTDFWWSRSASELMSPYSDDKVEVRKSSDILDIWFDSGLSWSAVLNDQIADLYLEGIDQFTGWFQSSLLTSVALTDRAPYKTILAHGFAVDDHGRKMSKSIGNVVNPEDITLGNVGKKSEALGIDVLRWWVAGHSLQHTNVPASKTTIADTLQSIKKIRNSFKFLLGAINDLPFGAGHSLRFIDQFMLLKLDELLIEVDELYRSFEFNKICRILLNFCTNELSSFYCTLTKDRLYCDSEEGRRAAQFTMNEILLGLLKVIGPILPVMTEEIFMHHPHNSEKLPYFYGNWKPHFIPEDKEFVISVLTTALKIKEEMVNDKPVNAELSKLAYTLYVGEDCWKNINVLQPTEMSTDSELVELFQVSQVTIVKSDNPSDLYGVWSLSKNHVCERCWKHTALQPESLCQRCTDVLGT